ncbi:MAG: hypothetical protein JXQ72_04605, partial [Anaerolineae bacterium]|nr:hypothetical protein [Anaerolineae bacterium]
YWGCGFYASLLGGLWLAWRLLGDATPMSAVLMVMAIILTAQTGLWVARGRIGDNVALRLDRATGRVPVYYKRKRKRKPKRNSE